MKLLLITLSILLTSSPLFGQETGVLYLWENGTKYMGEWKDGKRHGRGTMTTPDEMWDKFKKYVGEWKDGEFHGQGTMTYHDGSKFVGKWKNGKRHGQGTYTWCFYCSWCSGLPGGTNSSISSSADGRKYEGEWKDGVYHGHGTYTFSDGSKYEGSWKSGQMWNGIYYDNKGNLFGKQVNGEQQYPSL